MMVSKLVWLIGEVESGNNPAASATDYKGNVSTNAQYQQSAAYIKTYGAGPAGIENQARQLLKTHPALTIGEFYSAYNHGSVLPWLTYSHRFTAQAHNFFTKANAMGYTPSAPAVELLNSEV